MKEFTFTEQDAMQQNEEVLRMVRFETAVNADLVCMYAEPKQISKEFSWLTDGVIVVTDFIQELGILIKFKDKNDKITWHVLAWNGQKYRNTSTAWATKEQAILQAMERKFLNLNSHFTAFASKMLEIKEY